MSTSDAIVSYLKGRRLLLVLDNCEHLITEVRLAVTTLLQASVGVTVLAISRESLQLRGERVYRVPSLAFPSETNQSAQEALRYESVTLFVERARAAEPRFRLTDANAPAVVTICRRLDGVPLAIELAASKMVTLSPIELATRLNERFDVLKSSNAGLVPRQQTVNAMIGWSYELLSKREQRVLQCAALFPSDFGLDAALAICRPEETSESEVLEDLSSLVRKSLVASEVLEDNVRYRLLESVAAFAQDHLPADERESLSRRYAEFYCQRAESLERDCYVVAEQDWIRQAKAEIRHFRAALERSFGAHGDVVTGQRLVGALWPVWAAFAVAEGLRWNRVASGLLEADTPLQVRLQVLLANAQLYGTLGKHSDSFEAAEAALELGAKVPNEIALVRALQNSGSALAALGHGDRGIAYLKAALERAENLGKTRLVSFICNALGSAYFRCGDLIAARQAYSRALSESDAIGAERLAANIATNLAELEYSAGDPSAALVIVRKALARHQTLGNRRVAALCMSNLAKYIVALGRNEEGVTSATDAVKEAVAVEDAALTTWSLQHLAAAVALRKNTTEIAEVDASTAARLLAFVDTSLSKLSLLRDREEEQEYTSASAAIRTVLSSASLDALTAEGASWTLDRAVLEALHFEP